MLGGSSGICIVLRLRCKNIDNDTALSGLSPPPPDLGAPPPPLVVVQQSQRATDKSISLGALGQIICGKTGI